MPDVAELRLLRRMEADVLERIEQFLELRFTSLKCFRVGGGIKFIRIMRILQYSR